MVPLARAAPSLGVVAGTVAFGAPAYGVAAQRGAAGFEATLAERTGSRASCTTRCCRPSPESHCTCKRCAKSYARCARRGPHRDLGRVLMVADEALRDARSAVWDMRAREAPGGRDVATALEDSAREAVASHALAGPAPVEIRNDGHRPTSPSLPADRNRRPAHWSGSGCATRSAMLARDISGIVIAFEAGELCVDVHDDGAGFNVARARPTEGRGHWGLVGIRGSARATLGVISMSRACQARAQRSSSAARRFRLTTMLHVPRKRNHKTARPSDACAV